MSNFRAYSLVGTLLLGLATPASAQDADTVVATVNGTDITLGHMIVLAQRLPQQYQELADDVLFDGILEQLIQQTALGAQVGELNKRAELILENEKRALLAGEVIDLAAGEAVTDAAVQSAYDQAYAGTEPETEWQASHILVETEDEAKALVTDLADGADFTELAKTKSTGPSGPNGGELGWFGKGMMVPEFEVAVNDMAVGDVSAPIKTQFGWHVIKLLDTREKEAPSLDTVRDELADAIRQAAVEAMIASATEGAEITRADTTDLDPAKLRDGSLLAN